MRTEEERARLGQRFTCFQCQTKFYDLNRPISACPECGTDQAEAPAADLQALIAQSKGKRRKVKELEEDEAPVKKSTDDDDDSDDDDFGDLDDVDGDDDDSDDDDE